MKQVSSLKYTVLFFFLWLLITQSFSWLSFNRLRLTEPDKWSYDYHTSTVDFRPHPPDFLEMHARQDSAWYFSIAYQGYSYEPNKQSNTAFFPLYPLLMRGVQAIIQPFTSLTLYHRYLLAGTIVSWGALLGSVIILHKLFALERNEKTANLAVILLLLFPTSYFLTAVYSESLFLFLAVTTFYFSRKKLFFYAGIVGFLAALTRPLGVLLVIPLAYELMKYSNKEQMKKYLIDNLSLILIPLGLLSFMSFLYITFNDPFLFIHTQSQWGRLNGAHVFGYIYNELTFNHASGASIVLELIYLVFGIFCLFLVLKKERFSYGLWCLLSLAIPLATGVLVSEGRFLLVLFPFFLSLARILKFNVIFLQIYTLVSVLLLGLQTVLFVNGYWSF